MSLLHLDVNCEPIAQLSSSTMYDNLKISTEYYLCIGVQQQFNTFVYRSDLAVMTEMVEDYASFIQNIQVAGCVHFQITEGLCASS